MKIVLMTSLMLMMTQAWGKDIKINVNGMVCSMCAQGITKHLKKSEAIKEVHVDLDKKIVSVKTEGELDVSDEVLTKHIQEAGYNVASIERK